jgi:phenylalanyl-tRNA synthetase beta chain
VEFPQRVFEVGKVVEIDEKEPLKCKDVVKTVGAISDNKAGYEDMASVADAFLRTLGVAYRLKKRNHSSFIKGRCAGISVDGKEIGVLGEISPLVLEKWSLEKPVVAFELSI